MGSTFTERESRLMAIAWQCFSEQPKIDFKKMADLAGYTNTGSCSNAWSSIKKKLATEAEKAKGGASGEANGDAAKTIINATPRKRGKKVADEDDEEGGSPVKKAKPTPRKRGGKKASVEEKMDEEEAGEEASAVKEEEIDELV